MVKAVARVYLGHLFKKLWYEGKEFLTVGINLEVLFLICVYDMAISLILLEKEPRDVMKMIFELFRRLIVFCRGLTVLNLEEKGKLNVLVSLQHFLLLP